MVGIFELWAPIAVSAILVFLASSVAHMVLTYHRSDFQQIPKEEAAMDALRKTGVPPGDYFFPWCSSPSEMGTPEMLEKMKKGPVGVVTILPNGPPNMGKSLVIWFIYCLAVGVVVAYLAGRTLTPGTDYLRVFQIAGTVAFASYGLAQIQDSIWVGRKWSTTVKHLFDALIYALLTGGAFGWLWP